jgi:hypothetical protein
MNLIGFFNPFRLGVLGGKPRRAREEPVGDGCNHVGAGGAEARHERLPDHNPGRPFGLGENGAAAAGPSGPKAGPLAGLCG